MAASHPDFRGDGDHTEGSRALFGRRIHTRVPSIDAIIRISEGGDRFGLRRGGLTFRRLAQQHPHGVVLAPNIRTDILG